MPEAMQKEDLQQIPQRIYNHAISMKANRRKDSEIVEELRQMGVSKETALMVTAKVSQQVTTANNKVAYRNIFIGGTICLAGTVLTIISYTSAYDSGGFATVYWGAIIFGGAQFFRGLAQKI